MAIVTIHGIPVFDALVTDAETGMFKISLVDAPAVMSDFQKFDEQRKALAYAVADEDKRIVRGVVMRADFPIYRKDEKGEYYIIYKADTIKVMAEKYLLESRQNDVNTMHEEGSDVEGVQMVQFFIKDTAAGVNPAGFEDIADGSLFAEFHVTNDDVWQAVKDGTYKGFSLEGVFDLTPEQDKDEIAEIVGELNGAFKQLFNSKNMTRLQRFKAGLARLLAEFGSVTTDKGVLAWDGEEDLAEGMEVKVVEQDGSTAAASDGDYTTEDGKVIVVTDGKVAEIKDAAAEVAPEEAPAEAEAEAEKFAEVATDKGALIYEGEGELVAGTEVFVQDENGERTPAPDGDYKTDDGKVIKVVEGKVAEIVDDEAEVAPEDNGELAELRAKNAELEAKVAELTAQVEKMQKMSAAKPAHEEVNASVKAASTGNKRLDNLRRILTAK